MFRKGSKSLWFKTSFDHEEVFTECPFLKVRLNLEAVATAVEAPRSVSTRKKEGILKLIKHKFWADLPENDLSHDLVQDFE